MRHSPPKVIFVQGYGDYSEAVWPKWLATELVKEGFDFVNVSMPDPMFPEVNDWIKTLKDLKLTIHENVYFVGHSLGCITIARFLETLNSNQKAGGCVFVAGFSSFPNLPLINGFCTPTLNWDKVKEKAGKTFVILSDNDRMVPLELGQEFARNLGANIIIESGCGHFKEDIKEIKSLLNIILVLDLERQKGL